MHPLHPPKTDDSPLSRRDPRVKLLCALSLLGMVVSSGGTCFPLAVGLVCLAAALFGGAPPRRIAARLAQPALLAGIVILVRAIAAGKGVGATDAAWFDPAGLGDGLVIASRIIGACSVVVLLSFTTSFTELLGALAWLRVPRGLTEVSLFAWRSLFFLYDDARVVYDAQRNRLGYACRRRALASLGTLAGTMVVKAFDGSQSMTAAMAQRGYDGSLPLLRHPPFRRAEVAASLLVILAAGVLWRLT